MKDLLLLIWIIALVSGGLELLVAISKSYSKKRHY